MTAETLRRAAALMRERADDAVLAWGERPWVTTGLGWDDRQGTTYDVTSPEGLVAATPCEELSEHIASWHPAVALAVAAWLDRTARVVDTAPDRLWPTAEELYAEAFAVARLYLREES